MEYMDAGSLDKLQGDGVPEEVLARIAGSMVRGLKFLKDELQIIHRGMSMCGNIGRDHRADCVCRREANERLDE